jgi:hypothetical protein
MLENLSYAHQYIVSLVKNLRNNNPTERAQALLKLEQYMFPFGQLINNILKQPKQTGAVTPGVPAAQASNDEFLISFADYLDDNEFYSLADKVDEIVKISSLCGFRQSPKELIELADTLDQKQYYVLATKVDEVLNLIKIAEEQGGLFQPRSEGTLSSRCCPDHRGIQMARIGDNLYQCPLDSKQYDYQTGYINYNGETVVGGNVAAQTPTTSDYGGIPMRFYDSRSDVLNRIN